MNATTTKASGGKHAREEFRIIAEAGTILRCRVGSTVHGLAIEGTDDEDQMGICIEPPEYVIGLRQFDQYIYRTQPEGHRSGPGDLDLSIYSARKWMRLALSGNPTILLPLFVPEPDIIAITEAGRELRALAPVILSRQAGKRFAGYLEAQRRSLLSHEGKGRDVTRPELIEAYGFDTKYCGHMVRLGLQGVELLETGQISLPVPEPHRTWIRELRVGQRTMAEALEVAEDLEHRITDLTATSHLPEHPDRDKADRWLADTYTGSRAWQVASYQRAWDNKYSGVEQFGSSLGPVPADRVPLVYESQGRWRSQRGYRPRGVAQDGQNGLPSLRQQPELRPPDG